MADNDNNSQSVSIEEYNKLAEDFKSQKEHLEKLEKIFNERQTKTLDKEGILKVLGIEKAPEKPIAEVLNEKFNTMSETITTLQADLKQRDEKIALSEKRQKVINAAKPYNFVDINDVLGVIDYSNEDIDGQIKHIAETKKHWLAQTTNQGGSFSGFKGSSASDLETQLKEAQKNGNTALTISLKRQIYERNS